MARISAHATPASSPSLYIHSHRHSPKLSLFPDHSAARSNGAGQLLLLPLPRLTPPPPNSSVRFSCSVGTRVFVGLRAQTKLGSSESSCPNVSAGFYTAVNRRISLGLSNKRATGACISMMPIGTPRVPYRTPGEGTWQWLDIWNALYRDRIIFIGDNIDEEFSNQVLASMLYLDSIDNTKKIILYINGPGGDLMPCMALYDTMLSLKSHISTHCLGFAFDLAGFILAAGEKGSRTGMPLCRISLQSPAGAARGQADDIENEANELICIKNYLYGKLAEHTGHPVEKIHEDLARVKRFDAEGALEYGIIDCIIMPSRIKKRGVHWRKDRRNLGLG
ncbi:ATP-dependent Clp protease proteolytic subunit-related protein 2, chloroplastic-like [Phragmites australis]|uniref:ATP-dependent Clp protease proteolytic subunit-related protein 2, chloroplastic-like n=1 Tax=Phragmites australis TaxID=29695 RepID=UPI002D791EEC|nr:ATP-dependent Clp protease proteolytic subunit-related protein 2, chloroplastic-like [Phragmites australis]